MQTDIIYASHYDTVASVKDKIKNHQSARICLVLPTRLLLFNASQLNLLRRYCADLGLELALVTREFQTLQLAKQLNIQQYPSIRRARKSTWYLYESQSQELVEVPASPTKKRLNCTQTQSTASQHNPKALSHRTFHLGRQCHLRHAAPHHLSRSQRNHLPHPRKKIPTNGNSPLR